MRLLVILKSKVFLTVLAEKMSELDVNIESVQDIPVDMHALQIP